MKTRILVSGLGGSLFPYLHTQLTEYYEPFYVDADPSLAKIYPGFNFFPAPLVTHKSYPEFISRLISDYKIEAYVPLIDEEIEIAHAIAAKSPGLKLVSPRIDFCRLALDKACLMGELAESGLSKIDTWKADDFSWRAHKEVFVKPNSGRGSRGIRKITSAGQLEAYFALEGYSKEDVIVQEYIEGTEYTVGVLANANDEIMAISPKKILKKKGITIHAVTERNAVIEELACKVNDVFRPRGPFNIQLFLTAAGEAKIFEINPRFSTTTVMSYAAGIDEIGLFLKHQEGIFPASCVFPRPGIHLRRHWENVFYEEA